MKSEEIRKKFLDFFEKRGHKVIPSCSLVPKVSTSLFISAGMQQLSPYLEGKRDVLKDFGTRHLTSVQKCFRSDDIEEVGDDSHHTFFEMLGNWSIGKDPETGYFKQGAIKYALEFFCDFLKLDKNRIWITIFKGEKNIPRDEDSFKVWRKNGIPEQRIKEFGMEENFWGPITEIGPCGPCSEIYYDKGEEFGSNCKRFVELWNLVFMEYRRNEKGDYIPLPQKNVDTGIGFERLVSILQGKDSDYQTDLFWPIIQQIEKNSSKKYTDDKKNFRIIADHLRGICFLISEGILPGNLKQGYVLRRLLRRIQRIGKILKLKENWQIEAVKWIVKKYQGVYPKLSGKENDILIVIEKEKERFEQVLKEGIRYFEKLISEKVKKNLPKSIRGEEAFLLYQSYGFPPELTRELAKEKGFEVDQEGFIRAQKEHQKISRRGAEKEV